MTGLRFDPEWRITLLTLFLLPFLITLGFWQLQRAEEKAVLAQTFEARRHQPPVELTGLAVASPESLAYLPVVLEGRFLPDVYFLIDNRMHNGRFGNEVLAPLRLEGSGLLVLVNRGWLPSDPARLAWPEVPAVTGSVLVQGHVYVSPGSPYLLAEQELSGSWPKRIQAVEMSKLTPLLSSSFDGEVFPYPVRIDAGQTGALTVDWQIVNVSPEKHTGYAVQWFTMAAVLALFYVLRSSNLWLLLSGLWRKNG